MSEFSFDVGDADFDVQVCAVLGHKTLTAKDHARATEHVVSLLMRGCGL